MKEWIIDNTTVTEERYDRLINKDTVNKSRELEKGVKINFEHPLYPINNFTLKKPSKLRCKFYNIKKDGKYYIHKDLKFRVLAEIFDKKDPYRKELYTTKRIGTCFAKSLDIGFNFEDSNIVIAMCDEPFIIPTESFLHAFVCGIGKDGKEYVLDGTLNVIIEKDIYIKLYNARIITKIDGQKVKKDVDLIKSSNLGRSVLVHEYLCFPEEVMEGAKKYIKTR